MKPHPDALRELNIALDRKRRIHDLPNDTELAHHFGISPKTISFLRNGRWSKVDHALISVLTGHQSDPITADA